ncbi:MAG: pantetheine-phosphate adenylyltransferase [Oscillospiraceae bacterium]|nr:pantetheine-phosphate adenylyltransferase [Oscillospiraceae bacterium]
MKIAIYPGSFDPITSGHLNIIQRAANIFDRLIVCVMVNHAKSPMFTREERVDMIKRVVGDIPNVEVDSSDELLAEYAKRKGSCVIIKGLRAGSDFENEFQMALINRKINPTLDTMFLSSEHQYMYLSSSTVKELGGYDVDLSDFLPEQIIPDFKQRVAVKNQGGNRK